MHAAHDFNKNWYSSFSTIYVATGLKIVNHVYNTCTDVTWLHNVQLCVCMYVCLDEVCT